MPRRRGDGPGHAGARRKAQEATVRGPVADAVAEAHKAHAAARRDLTDSARAFLNETAHPAVRALNRAGAPTLLPAMHRIVNAIQPGAHQPGGGPLRELDRVARVQPVGPAPVHGEYPAADGSGVRHVPPQQRPSPAARPQDAAPYLNLAGATSPGGVSELDAALHLLHPPDEDLEVGEITVFVEGAEEAPPGPWPTNPVYDGTRPTPP